LIGGFINTFIKDAFFIVTLSKISSLIKGEGKMNKKGIKKIVAIIRPSMLNNVKIALEKIGIRGMSVTPIKGCGLQRGGKEDFVENTQSINLLDKVKIELVVEANLVEGIVSEIVSSARTGDVGDGKIFVEPVEEVIKIRTGKTGIAAI